MIPHSEAVSQHIVTATRVRHVMPIPRRRANTPRTVTGHVFSVLGSIACWNPADTAATAR